MKKVKITTDMHHAARVLQMHPPRHKQSVFSDKPLLVWIGFKAKDLGILRKVLMTFLLGPKSGVKWREADLVNARKRSWSLLRATQHGAGSYGDVDTLDQKTLKSQ